MSKTAQDFISEIEQAHEIHDFAKVKALLTEGLAAFPDAIELLCYKARSLFDESNDTTNPKEKQSLLEQGLSFAEKALSIDENSWLAHKWVAIITSSLLDFMGKKEKIMKAFEVKSHAQIAIEKNPTDATTFHLLGRLCFNVANISWIERKLAQTLLADPPTATFDEALGHFIKASTLRSEFISNNLWIAHTYVKLNNSAKAKEWYEITVKTPSHSEFDNITITEAKTALKKL